MVLVGLFNKMPIINLVTSNYPHEGKSTISNQLAEKYSKQYKLILIDADIRRPTQSQIHNIVVNNDGLTNFLYDNLPYKIHQINNYYLLPTDIRMTDDFPEEKFKALLTILSSQFEYILIDTPPIRLHYAGIISKYCDGAFFVINPRLQLKMHNKRQFELHCPIIENIENPF